MLFLRHTSPTGKERHYDSFLAGLLGGYTVFGRTIHNSVSQQIVIYVFARVALALAKLAVQPRHVIGTPGGGGGWELFGDGELRRTMIRNGWPAFASLSWAMVMYLFRWHPETVQSSLRSSMSYMWVIFQRLGVGILFTNASVQLRSIGPLGVLTDIGLAQQMKRKRNTESRQISRCWLMVQLDAADSLMGTSTRFRKIVAWHTHISALHCTVARAGSPVSGSSNDSI